MGLQVDYYGRSSAGYGNIIWSPAHKMRGGVLPKSHPCAGNPRPTVFSRDEQPKSADPLGKLRAKGYLASCFPEGDGISFDPPAGRAHEEILADFRECWPDWKIEVKHQ